MDYRVITPNSIKLVQIKIGLVPTNAGLEFRPFVVDKGVSRHSESHMALVDAGVKYSTLVIDAKDRDDAMTREFMGNMIFPREVLKAVEEEMINKIERLERRGLYATAKILNHHRRYLHLFLESGDLGICSSSETRNGEAEIIAGMDIDTYYRMVFGDSIDHVPNLSKLVANCGQTKSIALPSGIVAKFLYVPDEALVNHIKNHTRLYQSLVAVYGDETDHFIKAYPDGCGWIKRSILRHCCANVEFDDNHDVMQVRVFLPKIELTPNKFMVAKGLLSGVLDNTWDYFSHHSIVIGGKRHYFRDYHGILTEGMVKLGKHQIVDNTVWGHIYVCRTNKWNEPFHTIGIPMVNLDISNKYVETEVNNFIEISKMDTKEKCLEVAGITTNEDGELNIKTSTTLSQTLQVLHHEHPINKAMLRKLNTGQIQRVGSGCVKKEGSIFNWIVPDQNLLLDTENVLFSGTIIVVVENGKRTAWNPGMKAIRVRVPCMHFRSASPVELIDDDNIVRHGPKNVTITGIADEYEVDSNDGADKDGDAVAHYICDTDEMLQIWDKLKKLPPLKFRNMNPPATENEVNLSDFRVMWCNIQSPVARVIYDITAMLYRMHRAGVGWGMDAYKGNEFIATFGSVAMDCVKTGAVITQEDSGIDNGCLTHNGTNYWGWVKFSWKKSDTPIEFNISKIEKLFSSIGGCRATETTDEYSVEFWVSQNQEGRKGLQFIPKWNKKSKRWRFNKSIISWREKGQERQMEIPFIPTINEDGALGRPNSGRPVLVGLDQCHNGMDWMYRKMVHFLIRRDIQDMSHIVGYGNKPRDDKLWKEIVDFYSLTEKEVQSAASFVHPIMCHYYDSIAIAVQIANGDKLSLIMQSILSEYYERMRLWIKPDKRIAARITAYVMKRYVCGTYDGRKAIGSCKKCYSVDYDNNKRCPKCGSALIKYTPDDFIRTAGIPAAMAECLIDEEITAHISWKNDKWRDFVGACLWVNGGGYINRPTGWALGRVHDKEIWRRFIYIKDTSHGAPMVFTIERPRAMFPMMPPLYVIREFLPVIYSEINGVPLAEIEGKEEEIIHDVKTDLTPNQQLLKSKWKPAPRGVKRKYKGGK